MSTHASIKSRETLPAEGAPRPVVKVVRGRPSSDGAGVKLTRVIGSTGGLPRTAAA